jgi:hypothetical protein
VPAADYIDDHMHRKDLPVSPIPPPCTLHLDSLEIKGDDHARGSRVGFYTQRLTILIFFFLMEATSLPEKSVDLRRTTLRYMPEGRTHNCSCKDLRYCVKLNEYSHPVTSLMPGRK